MEYPSGRSDEAVTALLLNAGKAAKKLVRDILAQSFLAESLAGYVQNFFA
jgi:hypothetical protein